MTAATLTAPAPIDLSRKAVWTGRILSGIAVLFLLIDIYVAALLWAGLWLRDRRLRAIL
ncbi:MAG TPA: hypothetical protein VF111_05435 [Thermoanaerobaculia bacterium]